MYSMGWDLDCPVEAWDVTGQAGLRDRAIVAFGGCTDQRTAVQQVAVLIRNSLTEIEPCMSLPLAC